MTTPHATLTSPAPDRPLVAGDTVRILRGEYAGQTGTLIALNSDGFGTVKLTVKGKGINEQYMLNELTRTIVDDDAQPEFPASDDAQPEFPASDEAETREALRLAMQRVSELNRQLNETQAQANENARKAAEAQAEALKLKAESEKARKALESEKNINASLHRRIAALESAPAPKPVEPTPKRWEIRTLVQHLIAPEKVSAADAELAAALNDGWLIVDVTVTPALGGAGMPKHYRIVTLKRRAAATPPTPPAKRADILAQAEAVIDALDEATDDPADDEDTEEYPPVIVVTSPNTTPAEEDEKYRAARMGRS